MCTKNVRINSEKKRRIVSMEVVRRVVKEMEDRVECLGMDYE